MDSIPSQFRKNGTDSAYKQRKAYHIKQGDEWISFTYEQYYQEAVQVSQSLIKLGIQPADKICILSFNRPEWVIADLAAMMVGGIPAGIYQTCSPQEVQYIIHHSESKIVFVENEEQWKKVHSQKQNLPQLTHIILMRGTEIDDEMTLSWDNFIAIGQDVPPQQVDDRIDSIKPSDGATFIYTSGTTGPPKAVMLCHENLTFTATNAVNLIEVKETDCALSYLPLSHIAEQMFSIHVPIATGSQVYFAESLEKLPENLKEVQPTVFFGVPRIWEKFYAKITDAMTGLSGVKGVLIPWCMGVAKQVNALKNQGREAKGFLHLKYKIANRVLTKLKARIGLSRAHMCVSGAAPISAEILSFMSSLDIVVHEVYGQSEDCGPTSFNRPGNTKFGTVGPAFPGVQIKIADDGEILVKGKNVFMGYYKDPEATEKTLVDGWLHSGDLGSIDDDGFLTITGRKKEIIITAGGKNITPKNIEAALKDISLVSQAVVIGDRRKFLSALITLDPEATEKFVKENSITTKNFHESAVIIDYLEQQIQEMNKRFKKVENIRKFKLLPRDLTIEDKELTPTLKIKRRIVYKNWAELIESIYE